jgi:hypothetical protein
MASFAKLNSENVVEQVISVHNNELLDNGVESEQKGINFLKSIFGQNTIWKQASYNTKAGKHYTSEGKLSIDQSKVFRKNHPAIGWVYNPIIDGFTLPKPYNSWILDEVGGNWIPPIPYPKTYTLNLNTGEPSNRPLEDPYIWNEETLNWILVDII